MFLYLLLLPSVIFAQILPPTMPAGSELLKKTTLTISYNPKHKQADWVFYHLSKKELKNCVPREKSFKEDPETPYGAKLIDYENSEYDRGHLSPAADNRWSIGAMKDSFLLSNVSPQSSTFNRGIWAKLEYLIRAWAVKENIYVVTGPIFEERMEEIGPSHVSVPKKFFKVIVTEDEKEAVGIEMKTDSEGNLKQYFSNVRKIEEDSGLDFFPGLSNETEVNINWDHWDFNAKFKPLPCN